MASSGMHYLRRRSRCKNGLRVVHRATACCALSWLVQSVENGIAQTETEVQRILRALPQSHPLRGEVPMIRQQIHAASIYHPEYQQILSCRFKQGGVWLTRSQLLEAVELARRQAGGLLMHEIVPNLDSRSAAHVCHAELKTLLPVSIRDLRPFEVGRGRKLPLTTLVDPVVVTSAAMVTIVEDDHGTCVPLCLYTVDSRMIQCLSAGASVTVKEPYLKVGFSGVMVLRVDRVAENVVISGQSEFAFATNMPARVRSEGTAGVFDDHLECDVLGPAMQFFSDVVGKLESSHVRDQPLLDAIREALQQILGPSVKLSMAGSMNRGDDIPDSDFDVHFSHEGPAFTKQQKERLRRLLEEDGRLVGYKVRQGRYPTKIITPSGAKYEVVPKCPAYFHYGRSDIPIFRLAHDRHSADQLLDDFFKSNAAARVALKALKWVSRSLDDGLPSFMLAHVVQHSIGQFQDPKNVSPLALYLVALDELASGENFPNEFFNNKGALQALALDVSFPGRMGEERRNELISQVRATAARARQFASEWPSARQCESVDSECLRWIWLVKAQLSLGQVAAAYSQLDDLPRLRSAHGKVGCLVRAVAEEVRRRYSDGPRGVRPRRRTRMTQHRRLDHITYELSEAEGAQILHEGAQILQSMSFFWCTGQTGILALFLLCRISSQILDSSTQSREKSVRLAAQAADMMANSEFESAACLFEQIAELGCEGLCAGGMFHLSRCYYHGQGVERDYAQHVRWLRKAAAQPLVDDLTGVPDIFVRQAYCGLGRAYWKGVGVPVNHQLAREWLERAVNLGSRQGAYELGHFLLESGETESARRYFERAAEGAYAEGMVGLAYMQLKGEGGPRDEARAVAWLKKACAAGAPEAHALLAEVMVKGATPDFDAGIDLLDKEIRLGAQGTGVFARKAQLHWKRQEHVDRAMPIASVSQELQSLDSSCPTGVASDRSATEEDALKRLRKIRPLTRDEKTALRLAKRAATLGEGGGTCMSFEGLAFIVEDLCRRGRLDEARPLLKQLADSGSRYADASRFCLDRLDWIMPLAR